MRENLIAARGEKTQFAVAIDVKTSQQNISRLEAGTRKPSADLLARLVSYYNKPAEWLFPDIFLSAHTPKESMGNKSA